MKSTNYTLRQNGIAPVRTRFFPVFFMFLSFINMLFCLAMIFFVQSTSAYGLCVIAYTVLVSLELYCGIKAPISISMLALYLVILFLSFFDYGYEGYSGIIIFMWLTALVTILIFFKKPFTSFYSSGRGLKSLHYTISLIWLIIYVLSLVASLYFIPNILFVIIPYSLCILGAFLTVFMNLFWFGSDNKRKNSFTIDDFYFKRILPNSKEHSECCHFFATQMIKDKSSGRSLLTFDQIVGAIKKTELSLGDRSFMFGAYYEGKIVGSICCVLDRTDQKLPLEVDLGESLDKLRSYGKILYVGRLAIEKGYRERPNLINGLFKCFVDMALDKDISFVVATALINRLPTYIKLGFESLFPRKDSRSYIKMSHGFITHPIIMNFSRLILNKGEKSHSTDHFSATINRYLVERWYKRTVIRYFFKSPDKWPWNLNLEKIRYLLN